MRWDAIGDMVVCLPLFRQLRTLFPEAGIGIVASKRNLPLLRYETGFRVLLWDRRPGIFLRSLAEARSFRPDAVVDTRMHYDSTTSFLYGFVSRARWTLSASNPDPRLPFSVRVPVPPSGRHIVELTAMLLSALGRPVDPSATDRRLRLSTLEREFADRFWSETGPSLRGRGVILNVSARDPRRSWGAGNSIELLRALGSRGLQTLVFSAPEDREEALAVAGAGGAAIGPVFPDILHAAAVLEESRLLISPDTSLIHVASAHGVPVAGLYRIPDPHMPRWDPWEVPHRILRPPEGELLPAIRPHRVLEAVEDLLAARGGS